MVKVHFTSGDQRDLECNQYDKMKKVFQKWATLNGKKYEIIGENTVNGKKTYIYNLEFYDLKQKLLNPELPLSQQMSIHSAIIVVKEMKTNETNMEELKNEILEEIKSPSIKQTYDKVREQIVQYGYQTQKEIEEDVKKHPENYVDIKEAIEQNDSSSPLYALGKLGESLEKSGLKVVIDKRKSKNKEYIINNQFLSSGILNESKYEVHIDETEPNYINKLLYDKSEESNFISKWKKKFSTALNIPEDKIFIANIRKGSVIFDVIFKTDDFTDELVNSFDSGIVQFKEKMENFINAHPEIKSIYQKNILGACRLTLDMLDSRGNNGFGGWAKEGSIRGDMPYHPPDDNWVGFGLKVWDEYENNDWIGCNNNPNEWAVAYHGTSQNAVKPICSKNGKFWSTKAEGATGQKCKNCSNINDKSKAKFDKCGEGAYCSPFLDYAEQYNVSRGGNNGVILMCRVNPNEIRIPAGKFEKKEIITDGTKNSIRPYRLLYRIDN